MASEKTSRADGFTQFCRSSNNNHCTTTAWAWVAIARTEALQLRDATPLPIANCPTRRDGGPYPRTSGSDAISGNGLGGTMTYPLTQAARGDYAISAGDETGFDVFCQKNSPHDYGPLPAGFPPSTDSFSGISFCGTSVKLRQITDGLSKTIALGERFIPFEVYNSSVKWSGDDWTIYTGFQDEIVRSTYYDALTPTHVPRQDTDDVSSLGNDIPRELFGSAHAAGCLVSMCDGSVTLVIYAIDPEVFRQMGDRADDGVAKVYARHL